MSEAEKVETAERRRCQRFVARRRGEYCFFAVIDGQRLPLVDLSLDGFAIPASSPPSSDRSFEFVLQRTDVPDKISGRARVVNYLSSADGGQAGCLFDALDGDGRSRLEDWLTAHVLANASVPISEKDAARIVSGPSLV